MATENEEVILEFKIDQASALTELERTKKAIIGIKDEQRILNKAYKEGNITQDEYIRDTVRLESILKRQQGTYNDLSRSVTGQKNVIKELTKSNQDLTKQLKTTSQSFQDVASNINVAGVNVGSLTTRFASFANPATAAVAVVSALGSAYANSTIGARDLAKAQDLLTSGVEITSEAVGTLVSQLTGSGGKGPLESLTEEILFRISPALAGLAKINASAKEQLRDLQLSQELAKGFAKEDERRAEIQRRIRDDEKKSTEERLAAAEMVEALLKNSEKRTTIVLEATQEQIKKSTVNYQNNREAQLQVFKLASEIKDKEEEINGKLTENIAARQKILELQQADFAALAAQGKAGAIDTGGTTVKGGISGTQFLADTNTKIQLDSAKELNRGLKKLSNDRLAEETRNAGEELRIRQDADLAKLQSASMITGAMARLADEGSDIQRAFILTSIAADTAGAIAGGIRASQSLGYPANLVAMASTIAAVLANIATAKEYLGGAAAGGGDFITTKPTLLMVGDNPGGRERVTVEPLSGKGQTTISPTSGMIRMAGGGSLIAGDGGLNVNTQTADVNQAVIMANAMKRLPRPEVSVKEITKVQNRVIAKQNRSQVK